MFIAVQLREADATCVPGLDYGIFAQGAIQLQGNADTDSWDSSIGPPLTCNAADIGTNSIAPSAVSLIGGSVNVCGNVSVGVGGVPSTAIHSLSASFMSSSARTAPVALTPVAIPVVGLPQGPQMFSGTTGTLAPNQTYAAVTCDNCTLNLSAGVYVMDSLDVSNSTLQITTGPVTVYFKQTVNVHNSSVNTTNIPNNLVFLGGPAATTADFQNHVTAYAVVYAPSAAVTLHGNSNLFGSLVGASVDLHGNAHLHYDRALAQMAAGGFVCPPREVTRASPVTATISGTPAVVQGTYEVPVGAVSAITSVASVATFNFPYTRGHVRARDVSTLTTIALDGTPGSVSQADFSAGTILFDAATAIPPANNAGCATKGTCRYIFTNTNTPAGRTFAPPVATFNDGNATTIGSLIAPTASVPGIGPAEWQTIVRKVLAAPLGGVDRSIVAVIPPSGFAGSSTRPTIAYVGGTDGMLHAICASVGGTTATGVNICPSLGTELWAFLPRVQLPLVRTNTARIDGSVHVVDAFGDFVNDPATGAKSFRTVLSFQTGFDVGTKPAVYALDITDPYSPRLLWEYAQPAAPASIDLGTGLVVAMGASNNASQVVNRVVAQTNNGGTGGPGMYAASLELETGRVQWEFKYAFPTPPRGNAADLPLPTGIPGGAVPVDLRGVNAVTDYVMGDLFGNLWRLDANSGTSVTGVTPLFTFSTNKKPIGAPPAIFARTAGGPQYAAFTSGGYADPLGAAPWAAGTQRVVAIKLTGSPTDETAPSCPTCDLAINASLGAGERGFAQAFVAGNQLFVTTDTTDVNSTGYGATNATTGHVTSYDLSTLAVVMTGVIRGGATSIAARGASLVTSAADRQGTLTVPTPTGGVSVAFAAVPRTTRMLWLRN